MLFEIFLAFLEGIALILSPCILPVLPIILSASMAGQKKRPIGIIFGFIFTFSAFAILSQQLTQWLQLDLTLIKNISLILLSTFSIFLIFPALWKKFQFITQPLANMSQTATQQAGEGFWSGLFIGMLIGLIWTPCAGPILAAALIQVIRQESSLQSILIVIAFSIGASLPMLIIALTGNRLMRGYQFFIRHTTMINRLLGCLILLSVLYIAFGFDLSLSNPNVSQTVETSDITPTHKLIDPLKQPYPAPDFRGITDWLNSAPLSMEHLKGKVVLIDFWTYSCINCIRTLPYLTAWNKKYRDKGLVIVGIHSPEFAFEKNINNVKQAIKKYHIEYPVALDNDFQSWHAYQNHYWPAHYLIDSTGNVVYTHFGEGHYAITEQNIIYLLNLNKSAAIGDDETGLPARGQTPETYLGYRRMAYFSYDGIIPRNTIHDFKFPFKLTRNFWGLAGKWEIKADKIVSHEKDARLKIYFNSKKVFLVMGTTHNQPVTVHLKLNDQDITQSAGHDAPQGQFKVIQHRLYELINQSTTKPGVLEIQVDGAGLEAYAFTFGQ